MLHKAGFGPEVNLRMLCVLRDLKEKTLREGQPIISNLVSMNPGIDQRIEHMKNAMATLQQLRVGHLEHVSCFDVFGSFYGLLCKYLR